MISIRRVTDSMGEIRAVSSLRSPANDLVQAVAVFKLRGAAAHLQGVAPPVSKAVAAPAVSVRPFAGAAQDDQAGRATL